MEKRIELERRGKEPGQVTELNLYNARATHVVGLTDDYKSLESLSLAKVGLTSLKGFPKLPKLKRLELSDNRLSDGICALGNCPELSHLNLGSNKIKDVEALEPLGRLGKLTNLELFNNEVCETDGYRARMFKMLPALKYLDGVDESGKDSSSSSSGNDDQNGAAVKEDGDHEGEEDDEDDDDEEDDDEDDDEDEEEEEEEEDGPGLAAIYNDSLEDEEDGDYVVEDEELEGPTLGKRRKVAE